MESVSDNSFIDKENVDSNIFTKTGGVLEADLAGDAFALQFKSDMSSYKFTAENLY